MRREHPASATSQVRSRAANVLDFGLAGVLALLVLAVYPVPYLLKEPYYFDEQWVALSTRLPLSDLTRVTWTSPIGFSAVIRLIPGTGAERLRVVALLCAAGAVAVAYFLGRELRLIPLGGGVTGGAGLPPPPFRRHFGVQAQVPQTLLPL